MADLITTKAAFPKSGGLAVANGAVSVNAGNGLHVNPTTGMVEVPVDTTAGLGYGSNGLEVEVDDSTIGFNASGQLQALGGGGGASSSNAPNYIILGDSNPTDAPSRQTYTLPNGFSVYVDSMTLVYYYVLIFEYGGNWASLNSIYYYSDSLRAASQAQLFTIGHTSKTITKVNGETAPKGYASPGEGTKTGQCFFCRQTTTKNSVKFDVAKNLSGGLAVGFNDNYNLSSSSATGVFLKTFLTFECE